MPLWRSDYAYEPIGHQCMTYGISLWLPYHGTGTVASSAAPYYGGGFTNVEPYAFWSNAAPSLGSGIDLRVREIDYDALRRLYQQWRQLSEFYYGDFYPLTPYTQNNREWIAWQFNIPERGEGAVQAFRRPESEVEQSRLKLHGLDPEATYTITVSDSPSVGESGRPRIDERGIGGLAQRQAVRRGGPLPPKAMRGEIVGHANHLALIPGTSVCMPATRRTTASTWSWPRPFASDFRPRQFWSAVTCHRLR